MCKDKFKTRLITKMGFSSTTVLQACSEGVPPMASDGFRGLTRAPMRLQGVPNPPKRSRTLRRLPRSTKGFQTSMFMPHDMAASQTEKPRL